MCDTGQQHHEHMVVLNQIKQLLEIQINGRPALDETYMISATVPYLIDYKGRKHLFAYNAGGSLTLTIEDIGNVTLSQNTWIALDFQEGARVFASGQVANVAIFVRATDETIA